MKKSWISVLLVLFTVSAGFAVIDSRGTDNETTLFEHVRKIELNSESGDIMLIVGDDEIHKVRITCEGKLMVDGDEVELTEHDRKIVLKYYHMMVGLVNGTYKRATEAVTVGIQGATVALEAVGSVITSLCELQAMEEHEKSIKETEKEIEEVEKSIEETEKVIEEAEKSIEETKKVIEEVDIEKEAQEMELEKLEKSIEKLAEKIADRVDEVSSVEELRLEIRKLEQELQSIPELKKIQIELK